MNINQVWSGRKCKHIVFSEKLRQHNEPFGFAKRESEASDFMQSEDIRVRTVMDGFICFYNEKQAECWVPLNHIVSIEYDSVEIQRQMSVWQSQMRGASASRPRIRMRFV